MLPRTLLFCALLIVGAAIIVLLSLYFGTNTLAQMKRFQASMRALVPVWNQLSFQANAIGQELSKEADGQRLWPVSSTKFPLTTGILSQVPDLIRASYHCTLTPPQVSGNADELVVYLVVGGTDLTLRVKSEIITLKPGMLHYFVSTRDHELTLAVPTTRVKPAYIQCIMSVDSTMVNEFTI